MLVVAKQLYDGVTGSPSEWYHQKPARSPPMFKLTRESNTTNLEHILQETLDII